MQKQLITDQLIEEYQKELEITENHLIHLLEGTVEYAFNSMQLQMIKSFVTRLQSLRQQEVQNVVDAHFAGIRRLTNDPAKASTDYFTQTFEQKGGGNG